MPECSKEERAVLDALAKSIGNQRPHMADYAEVWFQHQMAAVHFNGALNLWRASLSRGAAGSETKEPHDAGS